MCLRERNCLINNDNSIISSKLNLINYFTIPIIYKIIFFIIISIKYFRKNILLFYIIVNLFFYDIILSYNKESNKIYIFKFSINKKKVKFFFISFIYIYFPTFFHIQKLLKFSININKKKSVIIYRFNYQNFPLIPESSFLYYNNEQIITLITKYQLIFDIYLNNKFFFKNSLEFLIRLEKLPVITKLT